MNRDKRKALTCASSIDAFDFKDIAMEETSDDSEISQHRISEFLSKVSNLQLKIIILKLLGYDDKEALEITQSKKTRYNDAIKGLKSEETLRSLYKRNFDGKA